MFWTIFGAVVAGMVAVTVVLPLLLFGAAFVVTWFVQAAEWFGRKFLGEPTLDP